MNANIYALNQSFSFALTPPYSEEPMMLSPESYNTSPRSDIMGYDQDYMMQDPSKPYLQILEQPTEKFRFRYKSEMSGTHGSLNGSNSDKSRKQTFPTVQLINFDGPAKICCTLYQCKGEQPHANRLVKKVDGEERDDPHFIFISEKDNYTAVFHSMGIIHTARRDVVKELERKMTEIKKISNSNKLSKIDQVEIKELATVESQNINLNIVCLRFDAFAQVDGVWREICRPIYSKPINNLKSALTGDLKIVRMDRIHSKVEGQDEVFLLVEKVTKKNIKIRFYEMDRDENVIWEDFGAFNDVDVHHQYAIVFRTPPYYDMNIKEPKTVFIELLRPSDNQRSEPRKFTYVPSKVKIGAKRARSSYSSGYSTSEEFSSGELPATLPNIPQAATVIDDMPTIDSGELDKLIAEYAENGVDFYHIVDNESVKTLFIDSIVKDSESGRSAQTNSTLTENQKLIGTVLHEIKMFLKTNPSNIVKKEHLKKLFEKFVNPEGCNILHLCVLEGTFDILRKMLQLVCENNLTVIIDEPNLLDATALHLAIDRGAITAVHLLLEAGASVNVSDCKNNKPLHIAVGNQNVCIVQQILKKIKNPSAINQRNLDGLCPLHISVKVSNLDLVKAICEHPKADINLTEGKSGRTSLQIAILDNNIKLVKYLLQNPNIDICKKDFNDISPQYAAKISGNEEMFRALHEIMVKRGIIDTSDIKMEDDDEDSNNYEFHEIKKETNIEHLETLYNTIETIDDNVCLRLNAYQYQQLLHIMNMEHMKEVYKNNYNAFLKFLINKKKLWDLRSGLVAHLQYDIITLLDQMVQNSVK